jgi:hypothetical protein
MGGIISKGAGKLILCCVRKRSGDAYGVSKYQSVLDIPCRKLLDEPDAKPLPLKQHAPGKKAYLFVNVAST